MNFTPSSGAEIQTEYFVPREKAYQAILAVEELRDQITPHLLVSEFRAIAADDLPRTILAKPLLSTSIAGVALYLKTGR